MSKILSIVIGYLLGCINPAAHLSKKHQVDLRKEGTKNLGASNTFLTLGKLPGVLVTTIDVGKGWLAARVARVLFPKLPGGALFAGLGALLGHIYPAHLGFRGGKGLAAFGGMVLAYDPVIFLLLLLVGVTLIAITDHSCAMPLSASVLFPIAVSLKSHSALLTAVATCAGILIAAKHWSNFQRAIRGEDPSIRQLIRSILAK